MNQEKIKELFNKEYNVGPLEKTMGVVRSFSLTEKTIFVIFSIVFILSGLSMLYKVNNSLLVEVPDYGGSLTEGAIGSPRFINPVLAVSDIDKDLSTLIYSGLVKVSNTGDLIPDLAESYSISEDGSVYSFKLREDAQFHDGTKITVDDILFTIEKTQDPLLKSPREVSFAGVRVEKVDDYNVNFILKQAYSPFIQNLTIGILPKHIWKDTTVEEFPFSQFNTKPVGSGPYKIETISYSDGGLPKEYRLTSFNDYVLGKPYITKITIKSYPNENELMNAYNGGDIEALHSISPRQLSNLKLGNGKIMTSALPRIFGVFFNQNVAPVLVNKEVRQALDIATNKQALVDEILSGYGQTINTPVPKESEKTESVGTTTDRIQRAKDLLIKNGWKENASGVFEKKDKTKTTTLSFSISTGNVPELKEAAMLIQSQWQAMGADVEVKIFEIGDLNQDIIKTRKYDALLFGEIVGRDLDLYPFWHSSNRNSPGLNIAMYTNSKVDKILDNIRKTSNKVEQQNQLDNFEKEILNDVPAVFTYSPYFIYVTPDKIRNVNLGLLTSSGERFAEVNKWYIETSNVWQIFNNQN